MSDEPLSTFSTFTVFTMDGAERTFDDNAEGFLLRWQEALIDPGKQWPFAYAEPGVEITPEDGVVANVPSKAVHFNPLTITAVEVEIDEAPLA